MPEKVSITKTKLDNLANAISAKSGEPLNLTIDEMEAAVNGINIGEENVLEGVKVNGVELPIDNQKKVNIPVVSQNKAGVMTPSIMVEFANAISNKANKSEIPKVPSWAKAPTKPTYTAQEVGALPDTTTIPTKVSDLTNDSNYQTDTEVETAITDALAGVVGFSIEIVNSLPATGDAGVFYFVPNSGEQDNIYDEYLYVNNAWEKIGDTQLNLSDVVTGVTLSKQTDTVLGENTTFTVGTPTITVTPTTTNIKATASGAAVGEDGTASAVTGYASPSTDTFVKSVSAETNKNLVTTSIPNVTGNTSVTANKSTWSFTMGSGDAAETLVIGGGNGSDVTATNTTLGTAITAATGETSTTGTGDAVVTGVTIGSSASAITNLGTPSTATVLTGVKITSQPTVSLSTGATAGAGVVSVATGITSATSTQPSITVGTNDKVTALTSTTDVNVTKGNS